MAPTTPANRFFPHPSFISSVRVSKLFGYDDLYLDLTDSPSPTERQINILYGENGQGKSTLLRLIYSIISSQDGKGLKNWVNRAPFSQAIIQFTDGTTFEVTKGTDKRRGLTVRVSGVDFDRTFKLPANEQGRITPEVRGSQVDEYLQFSEVYAPQIFYITDKREYFTNSKIVLNSLDRAPPKMRLSAEGSWQFVEKREVDDVVDVENMSEIIKSVFREEVFEGGVFAQQSSDQIYRDLIESISKPAAKGISPNKEQLQRDIVEVGDLISKANDIGVMPAIDTNFYLRVVQSASDSTLKKMALVLNPFLDSLKARVAAVGTHVDRMYSFLSELNHFYRDKEFRFDITAGFSARSLRNGKPVELGWLSSGERQLFTIMSSIFLTQSSSAIVLIDEPELSLNVLWQREFVDSLQRISRYAPVQYILASHSLEILSSDAGVVRPLDN